ncbi:YncE family protein [Granulicella cerasi]|uniref:YncE family protein n=1 Tax=Granulicella cerasi TaxID=741063 RepID=A0ABW1ZDI5_9BACT
MPLNNTQPFTATAVDTAGATLTGLTLTYQSTSPQTQPAASTGSVTPAFAGTAKITAVCQPPTCNPSPTAQLGYLGNGKPITSPGVSVTTTGRSTTAIYVASTNSQYIYPVDFQTQTTGNLVKLPYLPNSMVITQDGSTVYMGGTDPVSGGQGALMTYSTSSNTTSANTLIPGKVLAVSPDGTTLVVTDTVRQTVSLVVSGAVSTYTNGVGVRADWSPDSSTVYVTTTGNTILMHNSMVDWQTITLAGTDTTYNDVAVTPTAVGAYFGGSPNIEGRSYCSTTTVTTTTTPATASNVYAPIADSKASAAERVAATPDGLHILGASSTAGLTDLFLDAASFTTASACTTASTGVTFTSTLGKKAFAGIVPSAITGVKASTNSQVAFVTFTGTGNGLVPYYFPSTTSATAGTLNYLTLSTTNGTPTAPTAGVWATDNNTFYLTTAGDNAIHLITVTYPSSGNPTVTDSSQLLPALPALTGTGSATPNLIVQRPRKTLS